MKKFIRISLIFTTIVIVVVVSIGLGLRKKIDKGNYYQIDKNKEFIMLGHSHPECAYNDTLIDNFLNLSNSGESYFYTFLKLKKIIPANKHLKIIFIEFTNNVLDKEMDEWTWGDKYINFRLPKYTSSMTLSDYQLLLFKNWRATLNAEPPTLKLYADFLLSKSNEIIKKNDWGSYVPLERDYLAHDLKRIKEKKDSVLNLQKEESKINIEYLKKCVAICESNNTKLFFVRSPLHTQYVSNNEERLQTIYRENFQKIPWIDLINFTQDDSHFSDLEHLNYKGSVNYSKFFDNFIKRELRNFDDNTEKLNGILKLSSN